MALKVIDISYYNTITNWQSVKAACDAVIIRLGYRGCTSGKIVYDECFKTFLDACKKYGIPYSIYFFPTSISESESIEEAQFIINAIKAYDMKLSLPVFLDSEVVRSDKSGRSDKLSKARRTQYANRIFKELKKAGIPYGIYASTYWFSDCLHDGDLDEDCERWVAQYASKCTYKRTYIMWQYTSSASIAGVKGGCDASHLYTQLIDNKSILQSQDSHEDVIEKATQWMIDTANDSAHGYDQRYRWGEKGDYDCSSAVITAWQYAGVPVKTAGATYTGNMLSAFHKCGFTDVTDYVDRQTGKGMIRGDVLLNTVHHTAMYIGNGQEVEASINEKGRVSGGQPGDQTGKEFLIRSYRNYPWTHILRFKGSSVASGDFRTPSKNVRYTGIVATKSDPLNVRKGPGTEYGKCQTFGPLAKGTQVDVCDTTTAADGSTWLYICYRGAKYGFVSAKYIREV